MHESPVAATPRSAVDALLEESWAGRGRPVRGRELRLELVVTAAFLVAVIALVVAAGGTRAPEPAAAAVVLAFAAAGRVQFPIGSVTLVPTQLFLVPLFVLAPAQLVPALVFTGLALAALAAALTRRARVSRLVFCAGDATYSLGPALVFVLLADGDATSAGVTVILLAFAAQLAADFAASSVHELLAMGVAPKVYLHTLAQVWSVDAALSSIGLLAAATALEVPWAALAPLPFVVLLRAIANDRTRKIDAAHERLQALQQERARLRSAVQRVGDAFASNLDVDAVLRIVTRAAAEALDARAARSAMLIGGEPARLVVVRDEPGAAGALLAAERALEAGTDRVANAEREGRHALSGRVGSGEDALGFVAVAAERSFSAEEQELFAYLCEQATVSAGSAVRHEKLREAEASMRHKAFHDPLTRLANRARFADRVEHALAGGRAQIAVLFIDLDGFKLVNDTLGHDAGDALLVTIAQRLLGCLREGDTAGRFGGDEFAVLLEGLEDRATAETIAERLRVAISEPILLAGREFAVRGSVGIAHAGSELGCEDVMRRADVAMYTAKRAGGDRTVPFCPEMLVA